MLSFTTIDHRGITLLCSCPCSFLVCFGLALLENELICGAQHTKIIKIMLNYNKPRLCACTVQIQVSVFQIITEMPIKVSVRAPCSLTYKTCNPVNNFFVATDTKWLFVKKL